MELAMIVVGSVFVCCLAVTLGVAMKKWGLGYPRRWPMPPISEPPQVLK